MFNKYSKSQMLKLPFQPIFTLATWSTYSSTNTPFSCVHVIPSSGNPYFFSQSLIISTVLEDFFFPVTSSLIFTSDKQSPCPLESSNISDTMPYSLLCHFSFFKKKIYTYLLPGPVSESHMHFSTYFSK